MAKNKSSYISQDSVLLEVHKTISVLSSKMDSIEKQYELLGSIDKKVSILANNLIHYQSNIEIYEINTKEKFNKQETKNNFLEKGIQKLNNWKWYFIGIIATVILLINLFFKYIIIK